MEDYSSSTMLSFVDGAHVCSHAACGHHRFVVIGFDLDDVHRSGAWVLFRCCQANLGRGFLV